MSHYNAKSLLVALFLAGALNSAGANAASEAERAITLSCLPSTGGTPVATAGCLVGRHTINEINKCFQGRCFGPRNEVVKRANKVKRFIRKAF